MRCDEFLQAVAEGGVPADAAREHLRTCAGCRAMMDALRGSREMPGSATISEIQSRLQARLSPVKPLASNGAVISVLLACFVVFAMLAAIPAGYRAWHVLTVTDKLVYYGVILFAGWMLARGVVEQAVPGVRRALPGAALMAGTVAVLAITIPVLFPSFAMNRFVSRGVPCLRLGVICAAIEGLLLTSALSRGFLTTPMQASMLAGLFAGLGGFAVLALHCPILTAPHVWAWHLGAMLIAGAGGAAAGVIVSRTGSQASISRAR